MSAKSRPSMRARIASSRVGSLTGARPDVSSGESIADQAEVGAGQVAPDGGQLAEQVVEEPPRQGEVDLAEAAIGRRLLRARR